MLSNKFKINTATYFDNRSTTYDTDFHRKLAEQLVGIANLKPGEVVLDIATGTGLAAIEAAQRVLPGGRVVGIDIASKMLEQAQLKVDKLGIENVTFQLADAESLSFSEASFDAILCVSSLPYLTDIPAAIKSWHSLLKPEGRLVFQGYSEDSFITGVVLMKVAKNFGIHLTFNQSTGTKERCEQLLQDAGFTDIDIRVDQLGNYITFESIKNSWSSSLKSPLAEPLLQLSKEQLEEAEKLYYAELKKLDTDKGIWNKFELYYCFGKKVPKLELQFTKK